MYGTLVGTWFFAPGSKSAGVAAIGEERPWYLRRNCHQPWLYWSAAIEPSNTPQRHLSISRPNGRNATFSSASFICELSAAFSSLPAFPARPISERYAG